jgi:hypothetical protein
MESETKCELTLRGKVRLWACRDSGASTNIQTSQDIDIGYEIHGVLEDLVHGEMRTKIKQGIVH